VRFDKRFDKEGSFHTLEEDIFQIWKEHGLEVTEERVEPEVQITSNDGKAITIWTIKARRIPSYVSKIPS